MDIFENIFFWFVAVLVIAVFPIAAALIAETKGRSAKGWFLGCLLFPLSGMLILLALPSRKLRPSVATRNRAIKAKDLDDGSF